MIQQLIILGILKKGPHSGYDIKKAINKELGIFSRVDSQSIYYPLRKMEKEGIVSRRELKGKKHVRKYVYKITAKGDKAFFELCKKTFLSRKRPLIEMDVALYFLAFIDKKRIMPFLRLRLKFITAVKKWIVAQRNSLKGTPNNLVLLLDHHFRLATVQGDFLEELIKGIKNGTL